MQRAARTVLVIGVLFGAFLIQEIITTTTTFLGLGQSWWQWPHGLLILVAAGGYSRARGVRAGALRAEVTEG